MPSTPLIAIVDDDESVRMAAESLIRSLGFLARGFASAEAFLEAEIVGETACLISDIQMPGLTGLELRDALVAQGRLMPIIFITAYPEKPIHDRAQAADAAAIFVKPFDGRSLADCVVEVVRKGRARGPAGDWVP